ncbi:MAG: thioredoxin family protein, partial [Bacteroidota bacterium]
MKPRVVIPLLLWLFAAVSTPVVANSLAIAAKVDFKTSLSSAKKQAAAEGKLIFLDFVASWCMPCRWMDETTFSNPQVSNYLNQHYVPVKVDIDDFDGFALKQQYNIRLLPTMLIFDSQGNLLGRFEESLAPTRMLQILKQYNQPANRITAGNRPTLASVAPVPQVPQVPQTVEEELKPSRPASRPATTGGISRPALPPSRPRPYQQPEPTAERPPITASRPSISKPVISGEGLFQFSAKRIPSSGYSVQIGAFGEYGNVLREV